MMHILWKIAINSIAIVLLIIVTASQVAAQTATQSATENQEAFGVYTSNTITVIDKQNAKVHTIVKLTNLLTENTPSLYIHDIPNDASTISASDETGAVPFDIFEENGRKKLRIALRGQNVGMNAQNSISFMYTTQSLIKSSDSQWEIFIPRYSSKEKVVGYDVTVSFPKSWKEPKSVEPPAKSYHWIFSEGKSEPIRILFSESMLLSKEQQQYSKKLIVSGISIALLCILLITLLSVYLVKKRGRK